MMIEIANEQYEVKYTEDPQEITRAIEKYRPPYITYDTETTGLHLKKDRPFLGAVAVDHKVFVFSMKDNCIIKDLPTWAEKVKRVYCHNTTYDMHMTANITSDDFVLRVQNWGDSQCLARLAFEAVSTRDGGPSLKLKEIARKYIDSKADQYEKQVKAWLSKKESQNGKILTAMLREVGFYKKELQDMLNGKRNWDEQAWKIYQEWLKSYPKPTYQDVPIDIMLPYVATDVILVSLLVRKALPIVQFHDQIDVMRREFSLIPINYKMERVGIKVDREYLKDVLKKMEDYIADLNQKMHEIAGKEFTVGQHKVIKEIYTERLGEEPESTDKRFLGKMIEKGDELAKIITKLRRLEKWKSTYIERILEVSEYDGRFYTQLNPYGAVSGRYSGDAQQFPKEAIYDDNGNEIYHPRRAFVPDEGSSIYYFDYSQMELRVQAHYTMPFGGDLGLCRAYMPFKCKHYKTGEVYDHTTFEGRKQWIELKPGAPKDKHWEDLLAEGWSVWVVPETGQTWIPTDVHMSTTLKALAIIGIDPKTLSKEELKWWRNIGKRFNFMRNYGGGAKKAAEVLEVPIEHAEAMAKGYTDAFPLVVTYQNAVEQTLNKKGYVKNLYGRKYRISDSSKFYRCANYLIQGSCADMLKTKMLEIDYFLRKNNCKSEMILCVHDEIQFKIVHGEEWIVPHIKEIMEYTPELMVPIVVEVEKTDTNWKEKSKVIDIA